MNKTLIEIIGAGMAISICAAIYEKIRIDKIRAEAETEFVERKIEKRDRKFFYLNREFMDILNKKADKYRLKAYEKMNLFKAYTPRLK